MGEAWGQWLLEGMQKFSLIFHNVAWIWLVGTTTMLCSLI